MRLRHCLLVLFAICLSACSAGPPKECRVDVRPTSGLRDSVSAELLRRANHGRAVLQEDGFFVVPPGVRRLVIDVGAHDLEDSRRVVDWEKDAAVIAIEPLEECWARWPQSERLIALPVAVFLKRGTMDFHVAASDASRTSLAESTTGTKYDRFTRTVEVRAVPVVRLDDILSAIPARLDIERIDVDVQGADLAVLQSAGEQLRRAGVVSAEVMNVAFYKDVAGQHAPSEKELVGFMQSMGFDFVRDHSVERNRAWLEKEFFNTRCRGSWFARLRQRQRSRH